MRKSSIAGGLGAAMLFVVLAAAGLWFFGRRDDFGAGAALEVAPAVPPAGVAAHPAAEGVQGFLYGRITTVEGTIFEGRLRFGGSQEAFWGDYFHGKERENRWLAQVPPGTFPEEGRGGFSILGFELGGGEGRPDVGRQFMARLGEIARVEASGREVRVTLKSGTVLDLDRLDASDFDDGVRVWDGTRGVTDLGSVRIRTIELLPAPPPTSGSPDAPYRLYGTVRTRQGEFTGFLAWNRDDAVGSDTLDGRTAEGEESLRFDTVRSLEHRSGGGALVTLLDGRELVLSGTGDVGPRNRGIHVDDPRYGSVQVSWDAFERVDFGPGGSGPAYGDFPPGRPLEGSVTTRAGRRLEGRLVFDLDESETTDTLDADDRGLHYTIPFGLIASIVPGGRVSLHNGEELHLERAGDLRPDNAGLLVFTEGRERPEYVPWADVQQIEIEPPPAVYPPLGGPRPDLRRYPGSSVSRLQNGSTRTRLSRSTELPASTMRQISSIAWPIGMLWRTMTTPGSGSPRVSRSYACRIMVLRSWLTRTRPSSAAQARISGSVALERPRSKTRTTSSAGIRRTTPARIFSLKS